MNLKKIAIVSIIINILLVGLICNFIKNSYLNNNKLVLKAMTELEYEDEISKLNESHTDYSNHIQESKKQIATAITDMGVNTSNNANAETMSNNIRSISRDAISISYENGTSELQSTNIQSAVDELDNKVDKLNNYQTKIYNCDFQNNSICLLFCRYGNQIICEIEPYGVISANPVDWYSTGIIVEEEYRPKMQRVSFTANTHNGKSIAFIINKNGSLEMKIPNQLTSDYVYDSFSYFGE